MSMRQIEHRDVLKITSGQVIIDLKSVVKELLDNAIDAHASSIEIQFKNYGLDAIEFSDNGDGIAPQDYATVARRNYTSKITRFEDLECVSTLGFRGEAINSICNISDVRIITTQAGPKADCLEFSHTGELLGKSTTTRSKGTTFIIKNLFKSLPVREKQFVKNIKKEFSSCVALVQKYALILLNVKINVFNDNKKVVSTQLNDTIQKNFINVFGTFDKLQPIVLDVLGFRVSGLISNSSFGFGRNSKDRQFVYINSRPIVMEVLNKLVNEVYKSYNHLQFPVFVINMEIPQNRFDINLSPDKSRVLLHMEDEFLFEFRNKLVEYFSEQKLVVPVGKLQVLENCRGVKPEAPRKEQVVVKVGAVEKVLDGELRDGQLVFGKRRGDGGDSRDEAGGDDGDSRVEAGGDGGDSRVEVGGDDGDSRVEAGSDDGDNRAVEDEAGGDDGEYRAVEDEAGGDEAGGDDGGAIHDAAEDAITEKSMEEDEDMEDEGEDEVDAAPVYVPYNYDPVEEDVEVESRPEVSMVTAESLNSGTAHRSITSPSSHSDHSSCHHSHEDYDSESEEEVAVTTQQVQTAADHIKSSNSQELVDDVVITCVSTKKADRIHNIKVQLQTPKLSKNAVAQPIVIKKQEHELEIDDITNQEASEEYLTLCVSKTDFQKMRIIGQFNHGFIIVCKNEPHSKNLFIIDQHASDEKFNFEKLNNEMYFDSQQLVLPKKLGLSIIDELVVIENKEVFFKNGFKFNINESNEPGSKIELVSKPLSKKIIFNESDFMELIELIKSNSFNKNIRCSKIRSMLAMRACRKSIMIGRELTMPQMTGVVRNLSQLDKPWNCPHGRPTMRHLLNLEKWDTFVQDYSLS